MIFLDLCAPRSTPSSSSATYPNDALLLVEGPQPRGVFVLCNGGLKLSTNSADGKSILVHVAHPGEIVGLPATLSGKLNGLTAEALEPLEANIVPREAFLQFLGEDAEVAARVAEILSQIYRATLLEGRCLGFSGSAPEKLAKFLLDLPVTSAHKKGRLRHLETDT